MSRNGLLTFLLFSLAMGQTIATPEQSIPFNTARQMEKQNRPEEAIRLYQAVLEANPAHAQAYRRLVELLTRRQDYATLIAVLNNHLTQFPEDIQSRLRLAEVYYKQERGDQARAIWTALEGENSPLTYRQLFRSYISLGLEARMVALVDRGRNRFATPEFLALDLGNYYQARRVYDRAVNEYLRYVRYHPNQIRLIISRLLIMSDEAEARPFIEAGLKREKEYTPQVAGEILSAYYFKTRQFNKAFSEQLALPLTSPEDVERWLKFGKSLEAEKAYDLAIRCYEYLLSGSEYQPPATLGAKALIQMAKSYEAKILPTDQRPSLVAYFADNVFFTSPFYFTRHLSDSSAAVAFELYDSVLVELPASSFSALAHFRLGEIQYRITRNFDGALAAYEAALRARPTAELSTTVRQRLGEIYLAQGRLDQAREYFTREKNRGLLFQTRLIQALLYSGAVDSARALLATTLNTLKPQDDLFNDYLELSDFLSLSVEDSLWQAYWRAEGLIRQAKLSEAVVHFRALSRREGALQPYLLLRLALLYRQLEDVSAAQTTAQALVETEFADRGLVLLAELQEDGQPQQALKHYHRVLEAYPHSLLSEPVRLHLRTLIK